MLLRDKTISWIDKVFWVSLIVFMNPGGIQESFGLYDSIILSGKKSINLNDFLFFILVSCYLSIRVVTYELNDSKKISSLLIVFSLYYFLVFGMISPYMRDKNTDLLSNLIKLRHSFYHIFLFYMVFSFAKRSWYFFWRSFIYSSVFVLFLFFQSFLTGINILEVQIISRGFLSLDRVLLVTYGFLPFLTSIAAIVIIFKFKTIDNRWIIIGFLLLTLAWILSLTRRHIIGTIIYFLIAIILLKIVKKSGNRSILHVLGKTMLVIFVFFIIIFLAFPKYLVGIGVSIKESINVVVLGEESTGRIDERLTFFGREKMVDEFLKSPLFGTGFYNLWRTDIGDKLGYEASDYPFQAALAMAGLSGCFVFLPLYVLLVKLILKDVKNLKIYLARNNVLQLIIISILLYYLYDYIQYVNWFKPLSNAGESLFYLLLGYYCGVREVYYRGQYV